jgi:hypothetical protein
MQFVQRTGALVHLIDLPSVWELRRYLVTDLDNKQHAH